MHAAIVALTVGFAVPVRGAEQPPPSSSAPDEIVRRADRYRGIERPHVFLARIQPQPENARLEMVVEVRSNGFAHQLVLVLAPHRGDVMLATPDVVWLRPRRLHRLTRIPPELRMFGGASVSDVTTVDLLANYRASLAPDPASPDTWVLDLTATKDRIRYPRARYVVRRDDCRPVRIDFMTRSAKVLKSVSYEQFEEVAGRPIATKLVVHDHVYGDGAVVLLTDFRLLPSSEVNSFTPDYLLSLPDAT